VRPADAPQRLELGTEPAARVLVGEPVAQDLDGDGALVGGHAEEDRPHAALPEPAEQAVRSDAGRVGGSKRCDRHRTSPDSTAAAAPEAIARSRQRPAGAEAPVLRLRSRARASRSTSTDKKVRTGASS
jgi:hypothetical protein